MSLPIFGTKMCSEDIVFEWTWDKYSRLIRSGVFHVSYHQCIWCIYKHQLNVGKYPIHGGVISPYNWWRIPLLYHFHPQPQKDLGDDQRAHWPGGPATFQRRNRIDLQGSCWQPGKNIILVVAFRKRKHTISLHYYIVYVYFPDFCWRGKKCRLVKKRSLF